MAKRQASANRCLRSVCVRRLCARIVRMWHFGKVKRNDVNKFDKLPAQRDILLSFYAKHISLKWSGKRTPCSCARTILSILLSFLVEYIFTVVLTSIYTDNKSLWNGFLSPLRCSFHIQLSEDEGEIIPMNKHLSDGNTMSILEILDEMKDCRLWKF